MKDKKIEEKEKEEEARRLRVAIYLLVFFISLIIFSRILTPFFKATGIEKCKGIIFQTFKEDCFQQLASQTGNVSICNFTIQKEKCLTTIALNQKNISICNFVGVSCVNSIINLITPNECFKLIPDLKDYCLLEKATSESNESLCNLIQNSSLKEYCKTVMLQKQIATAKNFSICENLSNFSKIICYATIAKNLNTSLPINYLFPFYYNFTKMNITNITNITNLMQIVGNLSVISKAIQTKNLTICSTLGVNQSALCYFLLALNTTNTSICNYLPIDKVATCVQLVKFYSTRSI